MAKRTTIRDIAEKAGVSIGTVHCALRGKPGVGKENRSRILGIAEALNYRVNAVASSLKRKAIRLAAAFPGPNAENRFYFTSVWEGFHDYLESVRDYNTEVIESPYYNDAAGQNLVLSALIEDDRIDGILTLGYMDSVCRNLLRRFKKRRVPVVLVGSSVSAADCLCCVQPDYEVVGRTLAELLSWQAPKGSVLVSAGSAATPSHYQLVLGLEAYLKERGAENRLVKLHIRRDHEELYRQLRDELEKNRDIASCCAVHARGSVALARALEASGRAGTIPAIGCDVFEENIHFLEKGTFTNLVHKNPYSQAYMGTKCLTEFILTGAKPDRETLLVGSEIVFQSTLPMFRSGRQALHIVIG